MSAVKDGDWYVYTGEDNDAIAVAMHGRGPSGGWSGISLARMELPSKDKTREQINAAAKLMAAAPDMLAALQNIENDGKQVPDHAWALIQSAIAKATGAA